MSEWSAESYGRVNTLQRNGAHLDVTTDTNVQADFERVPSMLG